ncbi:protein serine/threonine phosphatase 2C [Linnemannia elongata AG-77]|uniref:Protein serine/threonine phosphatase 2C n=1 Tax=Linnemannia elongata AG-77 TaxID=1314771 RepID=A0A197KEK6_9FUNG|nr:protein serine/threonine phosphatase 2C [Linnemannia elongata AG-77]
MSLRLSALQQGRRSMTLLRLHSSQQPSSSSSFTSLRSSFSSSSLTRNRLRPTLTAPRPKKTPGQQSQQSQQVLPPNNTTKESPAVSRILPLNKNHQSFKQQHYDRLKNQDSHQRDQHQRQQYEKNHDGPGFNPWILHLIESRRKVIKAFILGGLVGTAGVGIYHFTKRYKHSTWPQIQADFINIRSSLTGQTSGPSPTPGEHRSFSTGDSPFQSPSLHRYEKQSVRMLSSEQVDERLAQNEKAFRVLTKEKDSKEKNKDEVIVGYCVNQVASNNPIEDDLSRHVIRNQNGGIEKAFFGVFDGHGGWCCSQRVALELAPSVASELEHVKDPHDIMAVMEAIENGFLKLDDKIVNQTVQQVLEFPSRPLACSSLLPAISGSCALMAYIDVKEKDLYVACTGDSRAVLGVRVPSATSTSGHTWKPVPLSFDQTGRNRWEVRRLQEEHPGEENTVVMRGRVLGGLEPTRAFGDARYKWTKEIQERVFQLFPSYRQPHRNYHTPPYVTAKPVVKHHKLRPEDRFLVMATDGLWDKLTNDEVIQLVGDLLDGKTGQEKLVLDREEVKAIKGKLQAIQGVITGKKNEQNEESEELTPANLPPKGPASQIRQFTFKDQSNASTHLVRNALGGGDDDQLAATLSIPSPMSRVYRDDITVTVIFFGQAESKSNFKSDQTTDGFVEIA